MIEKTKHKPFDFIFMHFSFIIYSFVGVFSKLVSQQDFFSVMFFIYAAIVIFTLGIYALLWQQVLRKFPLVTAYPNKGIVVMWNMIWAFVFFGETISVTNIIGGAIIIAGVIVVSSDAS